MKAIYFKEMRQYFHSVIGYVFLAIFVLINSYYFFLQNLLNRSGDITDYFQSTITIMMFLMPMLTMRSFSEEKKQRTDMLLLTMPIRREHIVLGKFLAAETVFLLGLAVTLVFPVILALCGSAQLCIILLMSVFIAVGIFISALTENQIVSAIVTYVIIFAMWYSYGLGSTIQNQAVLSLLNSLSLMGTYHEIVMGILNPAGIAMEVCMIGVFLFLTVVAVGKKRG